MTYPLVLDLAEDGVPVAVTCRVLGFSKQAFYKWRATPVTRRDIEDAYVIHAALRVHHDDPEFGYRFIADELAGHGVLAGRNKVARLCSGESILSTIHRRRRGAKRPGPAVHDDLVNRDFSATGLDQVWLTDITEHWTDEGRLYLCAIKDVYSNKIVGYSINSRMTSSLAVNALANAITTRTPESTIVHSDRGSQFRSHAYVDALTAAGLRGSMGRVAAAGDNAAMESFFALLQKNVLNRHRWTTRDELRLAIVTWIEKTYHRRRRQERLGRLTPVEFERLTLALAA